MKNWVRFILVAVISLCIVLGSSRYTAAEIDPSQLVGQAENHYHLGKSERSRLLLNRAEQIYQSQGAILPLAQVLALTSLVQQQQGNWELARSYLDRSFALIAQIPNSKAKVQVQAQIGNSQGHYDFATGQYRQALANWQQAEKLYRQIGDMSGVAGTLLSQTETLNKMGFHRRACNLTLAFLDPTQQRCQNLQSSTVTTLIKQAQAEAAPWLADSFNSISNSLLLMGKLDFAMSFVRASRNASSLKDFTPNTQAKIILNLGNINSAIAFRAKEREDLTAFRSHRRQALKYFQQLETNQTYKLTGQLNRLSLSIASQEWSQATKLANKIQLLPEDKHNLYAQVKFANSLFYLQQRNLALKYAPLDIAQMYLGVIAQARRSGDARLESSAWGNLGEMHDSQLRLEYTPQQLYERALLLAQSTNAPEMAYRWQWRLGRIYRQQGLRAKAIASYRAAIANLDSLRSDLAALEQEVQYEFKEQIEPVYRELADLLLKGNPSDRDLQAARDTIEALQIAELDNYFQDACLTFEPKSIDAIDPNAALIYTIILPDRLEIIMANMDRTSRRVFHHYSTSIEQNQLEQTIQQLRLYITERDRTREVEQLSQQIYRWLIEPLTADLSLQQSKTLVFVLDGMLQTIPMSVLYDGKQYLLEKYAIALTPGLRLLNPQQDSRPLSFLAGGISRQIQVDNQNFAALKNVPNELKIVGQQKYPPLLDREFTPDNLLKQLDRTSASVVHLATHAQFSANPQQTFLLMWQKLLSIKEFSNVLQNRTKAYRRPIKLLVLSACDTAAGDRRATLGLAGIAVRSGALSTIATLWQIDDESTSELMKHFYQHLDRHSKAEALRLAQLELWSIAQKDWQVPAFWSAYVIIGNWQ